MLLIRRAGDESELAVAWELWRTKKKYKDNMRLVKRSGERAGGDGELFVTPWTISSGSERARR